MEPSPLRMKARPTMSSQPLSVEASSELPGPPSIFELWTGRYRGTTLAVFALMFLTAFEALAVTTAMPTVATDLGGIALYGIAFAAPMATGVIAMTISGFWNDRSGPRKPILAGVTLFASGLIVAGFAPSMLAIVIGRGIQGLGSGLLSVSLYVMIGQAYEEEMRPRMFTILTGAWILPALIGPAISGLVAEHLGWRWLFLGVPFLVAAAILMLLPTLRRLPAPEGMTKPLGRKPIWAAGAAIAIVVLNWAGQRDIVVWPILLVASLVALGIAIPKLLPAGVWQARRGLPTVITIRGLIGAAFAGTEVYLPLLFKEERGLSPSLAGLVLTSGALTWFAGSWIAGRPEHRLTTPIRIRIGALLIFSGIVTATLTISEQVPVAVGAIGWGLSGLGMGLVYPILSTITLSMSKPEEQGVNS
ncbi:MAG TPA: MFS transporter, partial [Thermomicrobiales bacterium]|nr:MFS transporter [Thermomicrobiales bacterium]